IGPRSRTLRWRAPHRRDHPRRLADDGVDRGARQERRPPAARPRVVRAGVQWRAHRVAGRRSGQRVIVARHPRAGTRDDAGDGGEQPGAVAAVRAVGGRCHRLAVRSHLLVVVHQMKTTHLAFGAAVMAAMLATGTASAADNQIRPYFGATFGGGTTFVDLEKAAGKPNKVVGVSVVTLGEMLGGEVDLGDAPGFFQAGDQHLVLSSRVTTLMGNVVIAAPRKLTEYSLRPYIVGGGGLMRARIDDYF